MYLYFEKYNNNYRNIKISHISGKNDIFNDEGFRQGISLVNMDDVLNNVALPSTDKIIIKYWVDIEKYKNYKSIDDINHILKIYYYRPMKIKKIIK